MRRMFLQQIQKNILLNTGPSDTQILSLYITVIPMMLCPSSIFFQSQSFLTYHYMRIKHLEVLVNIVNIA